MLTNHSSRVMRAVGAAVALCMASSVGSAQSRDVVFQHGLWSSSETWQQEAANLSALYLINPFTPTTTSSATYASQAGQLTTQVSGAATSTVFIGHSNGGNVGRLANVPAYNNRAWGGLVTVGTPHGGAQLMASAVNGDVTDWILGIAGDVGQAVDYYWNLAVPSEIARAIEANEDVIGLTGQIVGELFNLGFNAANPVAGDMVPGSYVLANVLNPQPNRTREASAIPSRVGIRSTLTSNTGLVWKGLYGESWQSKRNAQIIVEATFWTAYGVALSWEDENDPQLAVQIRGGANLLQNVAVDINGLDDDYCFLMGAWVVNQCGASDGIVPWAAQEYLGASQVINVTGSSHKEETRSTEVDGQLQDLFDNVFGIARRPPPPPPSWAIIHGPSSMRPGNTCYWYASTNVSSPGYEWEVNGNVVGTSSDLWYSASADFELVLRVWNGSAGANTSQEISVSTENESCAVERPMAPKTAVPVGASSPTTPKPARVPNLL